MVSRKYPTILKVPAGIQQVRVVRVPETMAPDEMSLGPACRAVVTHNLVNALGGDARRCGLPVRPGELPAREERILFEGRWGRRC